MKNTLRISLTIILISTFLAIFVPKLKTKKQPRPTEIGYSMTKEIEMEHQLKRELWLDEIHNSAQDVKWKKANHDARYERHKSLFKINYKNSALDGYWKEVGSKNQAGRIHLSEIDTSTGNLYCASSGGNIWKKDSQTSEWSVLNNQLRIPSIHFLRIISHNRGKRLLAGTSQWEIQGFYYSDDDGANWTTTTGLSGIEDWGYIKRVVINNDEDPLIYLLAQEWDYEDWAVLTKIYYSTDLGESFSVLKSYKNSTHSSPGNFDIWCSRYANSEVYLIQNDSLQIINSDQSISNVSSELPFNTTGQYYLSGCINDGTTHLYLMENRNAQGDIYASHDNGLTWEAKGNVPENPFMRNSFECSAKNPDVIYFGGVNCYKSYDGGSNWEKINSWADYYGNPQIYLHADICGINSFLDKEGNETVYVSTDGGIYISIDSLENVQNISLQNLNAGQYYSTYTCRFNTDISHAGSQDQGYQMSIDDATNGPVEFDQIISGDYGHIVSGDDGASIWMVYPGFAAYYPDINNSTYSSSWDFVGSNHHWIPPLMVDPDNPEIVYMGGGSTSSGAHIFTIEYNNGRLTHTEGSYDFSGSNDSKIAAMAHSPIDHSIRYLTGSNGEFYRSEDSGNSWVHTDGFTGPWANYLYGSAILTSSLQEGKIYVAGSGYSNPPVYLSTDHGDSFTAISNGLPSTMVYEIAQHPNEKIVFAATDVGPYVYLADENQWYSLMDDDSPDQVYWSVDFIPELNTARFGTYGRGIWDFVVTDNVGIDDINHTIDEIIISPNPTTGTITINGNMANAGLVRIYNNSGQAVYQKSFAPNETLSIRINIEHLPKGVYHVVIGNSSQKLVLQ